MLKKRDIVQKWKWTPYRPYNKCGDIVTDHREFYKLLCNTHMTDVYVLRARDYYLHGYSDL